MGYIRPFRNFSIIATLLLNCNSAVACAFDFSMKFAEACLFQPTLEQKRSHSPFLFTYSQFYYYGNSGLDNTDRLQNAEEWCRASGADVAGVSKNEAYAVLYHHSAAEFIYAYEKNKWEDFSDNAFISFLRKNNKGDFLKLLYLAKRSEALKEYSTDPWNEEKENGTAAKESGKLIEEIDAALLKNHQVFVKQRLAYLRIRLAYSRQDWQSIMTLFRNHLDKTGSITEHWARHFNGFALWNTGDSLGATADLLLSFDRCEEKKLRIMQSLHLPLVRQLLLKTNGKELRHLASVVLLLNNPGPALRELTQFLRDNPESPYQDLLLARELSKCESWIFSYSIFDEPTYYQASRWQPEPTNNWELKSVQEYFQRKNLNKDLQHLRQVRNLIRNHAASSKHSGVYRKLLEAHMGIVLGEFANAEAVLNSIAEFPSRQHRLQWLTEMMFLQLQWRKGLRDPLLRNSMAGWMKELQQTYLPLRSVRDSLGWELNSKEEPIVELATLGAKAFRLSGDIPTAWMFEKLYLKSWKKLDEWQFNPLYDEFLDKYASEADLDMMLKLANRKMHDSLQAAVIGNFYPDTLFLLDLKGTKQIRRFKYKEALQTLSRIPAMWFDTLPRYKNFFSRKSVATDMFMPVSLSKRDTLKHANKLEHLKELLALTDRLEKAVGDEKAKLLYDYGNALVNMSCSGRKWMMTSYWSYRYYGEFNIDSSTVFYQDYGAWDLLFLKKATQCFEEAKRMSADKNLQAACCVMQMVIEEPVLSQEGNEEVSFLTVSTKGRPRLSELRRKYAGTEVYEQVKTHCW